MFIFAYYYADIYFRRFDARRFSLPIIDDYFELIIA